VSREYKGLLLADGSSDRPLADHAAELFAERGCTVLMVVPELDRLTPPPARTVEDQLRAALRLDDGYDVLVVHRDAEGKKPMERTAEIANAVSALSCAQPHVPIVPVRMTEAWLLTDESTIRTVAGRPSGRQDLKLPPSRNVERINDPKEVLKAALIEASGLSGRHLDRFKQRFGEHRRQLLHRLDRNGPVCELQAWKDFVDAVDAAVAILKSR